MVFGEGRSAPGKPMKILSKIHQNFSRLKLKVLGYAIIEDIPTDQFTKLIEVQLAAGWKKSYEYDGFDAWIDYGKVKLERHGSRLTFEWDNWSEGRIEGHANTIESLAVENDLKVTCSRDNCDSS